MEQLRHTLPEGEIPLAVDRLYANIVCGGVVLVCVDKTEVFTGKYHRRGFIAKLPVEKQVWSAVDAALVEGIDLEDRRDDITREKGLIRHISECPRIISHSICGKRDIRSRTVR